MPLASVEQIAQCLDIERSVVLQRPPVADLAGAVDDHIHFLHGPVDELRIVQLAFEHGGADLVQQGGVAGGPRDGHHLPAAVDAGFGNVPTDEAGGAGDQKTHWHRYLWEGSPTRKRGSSSPARRASNSIPQFSISSRVGGVLARGRGNQ